MKKLIPIAPWQTSFFTRWLRDMARQGWELKDTKGVRAVFVPAAPGSREYALFPPDAAPEELDELFRRIDEGGITVPPELERPVPSRLALPEAGRAEPAGSGIAGGVFLPGAGRHEGAGGLCAGKVREEAHRFAAGIRKLHQLQNHPGRPQRGAGEAAGREVDRPAATSGCSGFWL